jgi:hypothetical protein
MISAEIKELRHLKQILIDVPILGESVLLLLACCSSLSSYDIH